MSRTQRSRGLLLTAMPDGSALVERVAGGAERLPNHAGGVILGSVRMARETFCGNRLAHLGQQLLLDFVQRLLPRDFLIFRRDCVESRKKATDIRDGFRQGALGDGNRRGTGHRDFLGLGGCSSSLADGERSVTASPLTAITFDNPIWHREDWRIWQTGSADPSQAWTWAHDDADREDDTDRRHGTAPSLAVARQDINEIVDTWIESDFRSGRHR